MKKIMKAIKRKEAAVSPVIGVILMVGITVAIAATVYAGTQGMLTGVSEAPPQMSFLRGTGSLTVATAAGNYDWSLLNITMDGEDYTLDENLTGTIKAGQTINDLEGRVVISYNEKHLIGTWDI